MPRTGLRERLLDRSSSGMSRRQIRMLGLAGTLGLVSVGGVLQATGVAPRDPAATVPGLAAAPALERIPTAEPTLRVASIEEVDPVTAGLDPTRLDAAVAAVVREVARGAFPGAALVVGRGSNVALTRGVGQVAWGEGPVDPNSTVYDLASLTKVVGTTTAVMLLVEDGKLELDAPVQRYVPEFSGDAKALVTVRHLLTHTSGLPAGVAVGDLSGEAVLRKILQAPLKSQPGEEVEYSDPGFVVLALAAERAAGEPMAELLQRRVFRPLGMNSVGFLPGAGCVHCAPTLIEKGEVIRGTVHDPIARRLGGVAGNAGLFGTATDLARFAAMMASGGELNGVRVLQEETIRQFTGRQPGAETRALGWDTPDPRGGGAAGLGISPRAFGHTGYTGTSLWVDPDRGTWTVLLTNRTYEPRAVNRIQRLRRQVHSDIADAAERAAALAE